MTTLEKFAKSFDLHKAYDDYTKWEWASSRVFGLYTYDSDLDEKFVRKILEVCKVILNSETYEYIDADETNYINYILVCQVLNQKNWISCGTSIRGAWFDPSVWSDLILMDGYRSREEGEVNLNVKFSKENLQELIKFIEGKE